ncbi:MAG: glycosyltransferase family 4 protein [Phycisphaerae bacterium]|nr:glycosyltransferase family 4 protein [Phycisphaerae bacterium]
MNILVISNNPDRPSYRQRFGIYIERLCAEGFEIELVKYPRGFFSRFRLFVKAGRFDGVFLHKKRLNFFDAFFLRKFARKIVYDFDVAVMYDDKRPERKSPKRLRDFARTTRLADTVIAGNSYLADHALKYNNNVEVLPTGLDVDSYDVQTDRTDDGKVRLVWIGSKSTLMYLEELKEVLEEIGRRFDNVVLRIICDAFFDLENMEVEKVNWSLDSQARNLRESDIGLAPLPDDNFTRGKCGFKILQYMAASLAVVASPVGVNRDFVNNGVSGYIAGNQDQWFAALNELIADKQVRDRMGKAARKDVDGFDLRIIGGKLTRIIQKTLGES